MGFSTLFKLVYTHVLLQTDFLIHQKAKNTAPSHKEQYFYM